MGYSTDLRLKVMHFIKSGKTQEDACKVFQIGLSTVKRWVKRYRETGSVEGLSTATNKHQKHDPEELRRFMGTNNDATLSEIAEHFKMTIPGIWYALGRLKITLKKRHFSTKNEMNKSVKDF